eukprot:352205-Chlamydomonas_euryale.AAC.7
MVPCQLELCPLPAGLVARTLRSHCQTDPHAARVRAVLPLPCSQDAFVAGIEVSTGRARGVS